MGTCAVSMVVYSTITVNADACRGFHRINIGSKEEKLPAILFFLMGNHLFNCLAVKAMACVFHPVCHNYKCCVFRHIFRPCIAVYPGNMTDGFTECIEKGCAATNGILFFRHRPDFAKREAVMDHFTLAGKKHRCYVTLAVDFFLFFNKSIETADGIALQPAHGAAAIQDKH